MLAPVIANFVNAALSQGANLSTAIGPGILIPLAKPNKPKGPVTSLRPITLLNSIRKVISIIVLRRITESGALSRHLGTTQSGFRPGRSTADVVWTQRWIAARAIRYRQQFHILGLDMSKAFDTINRLKLLEVMSAITNPDCTCLIHHLLHNTTITVKVASATAEPFESTIGTPQGDSLSPVLFICYLEAALQECRTRLAPRPAGDASLPPETGYADDISYYSTCRLWLENALPVIADTLHDWSLNVNPDKTEWIRVSPDSESWRTSRQLGSLMGEEEDVRRRMELASRVFGQLYALWLRRDKVAEKTRLRLYNAIVLPTFLYNCETWGLSSTAMAKADAFHRRQMRSLLGIRYPDTISNDDLYRRTKSNPISDTVACRRLRMTGHVLRMDTDTPPQVAMSGYFDKGNKAPRGRPRLTLATSLVAQLNKLGVPMKTMEDLSRCRQQAADKTDWRKLCSSTPGEKSVSAATTPSWWCSQDRSGKNTEFLYLVLYYAKCAIIIIIIIWICIVASRLWWHGTGQVQSRVIRHRLPPWWPRQKKHRDVINFQFSYFLSITWDSNPHYRPTCIPSYTSHPYSFFQVASGYDLAFESPIWILRPAVCGQLCLMVRYGTGQIRDSARRDTNTQTPN